jgi:hypothetical protein
LLTLLFSLSLSLENSWFHGFIDANDVQNALKNKKPGTFLFRFSTSNPGLYAISVVYGDKIGHWRIACEKEENKPPIFKIDGRTYKSLQHIYETHKSGGEPLKARQSNLEECYLLIPLSRTPEADSLYQNV